MKNNWLMNLNNINQKLNNLNNNQVITTAVKYQMHKTQISNYKNLLMKYH